MDSALVTRLVVILVCAVVLFALLAWYNHMRAGSAAPRGIEGYAGEPLQPAGPAQVDPPKARAAPDAPRGVAAAPGMEMHLGVPNDKGTASKVEEAWPADTIMPHELLPGDGAANSKWAQMNPAGQGAIGDGNLLTAGYHIGYNTVGSSLKNASLDIRSTPPNPRIKVSVWNQSTIEPDLHRRPFE